VLRRVEEESEEQVAKWELIIFMLVSMMLASPFRSQQ
jgi:hypothetical protein